MKQLLAALDYAKGDNETMLKEEALNISLK